VKKEVIQEAADFFRQQVVDGCCLIELSRKPNSGISIVETVDKLKKLGELVERHRSFAWAFPNTHATSIKEIRSSKTLWDFVFSDLKRFVSRTVTVHYQSSEEFTKDVVNFLSASGLNNQPLQNDGMLGLDKAECDMMTPDPVYVNLVASNQSWIFHLAFVIDCYLLHHSVSHLASELSKVNASN
jgi:hypothetical protein